MKRWIVLFLGVLSFAYEANIVKVEGRVAFLDRYVEKGVSGIVICPYMKKEIICARAIAFGTKAKLYYYSVLKNKAFALPLVYPKPGDKLIVAKNYNRIMIIAPTQTDYLKIKNMYKQNVILSPDLLATFGDDFTRSEFINLAKNYDIGRYIFAIGNKLYEVDALSFYVIREKTFKAHPYKKAFFTYLRNFDIAPINFLKYFRGI
jgi:hypothetical protein